MCVHKKWSVEDVSFLRNNMNDKTLKQIAIAMDRTEGSVRVKKTELLNGKGTRGRFELGISRRTAMFERLKEGTYINIKKKKSNPITVLIEKNNGSVIRCKASNGKYVNITKGEVVMSEVLINQTEVSKC